VTTLIEFPVTAQEMTHPAVLDVFGAHVIRDNFGLVDIEFPSVLKAARWSEIWAERSNTQPEIAILPNNTSIFGSVTVTVRR
jgi:hypothetical protein